MESLSNLIRVNIPHYLANLPIPKSVGGIFHLSIREWVSLTPLSFLFGSIAYYSYKSVTTKIEKAKACDGKVNKCIKKDCAKVVDTLDIEDMGDKNQVVYCRCWKSTKFPLCDGSHNAHNEETGDNVGPLIVKKKK